MSRESAVERGPTYHHPIVSRGLQTGANVSERNIDWRPARECLPLDRATIIDLVGQETNFNITAFIKKARHVDSYAAFLGEKNLPMVVAGFEGKYDDLDKATMIITILRGIAPIPTGLPHRGRYIPRATVIPLGLSVTSIQPDDAHRERIIGFETEGRGFRHLMVSLSPSDFPREKPFTSFFAEENPYGTNDDLSTTRMREITGDDRFLLTSPVGFPQHVESLWKKVGFSLAEERIIQFAPPPRNRWFPSSRSGDSLQPWSVTFDRLPPYIIET